MGMFDWEEGLIPLVQSPGDNAPTPAMRQMECFLRIGCCQKIWHQDPGYLDPEGVYNGPNLVFITSSSLREIDGTEMMPLGVRKRVPFETLFWRPFAKGHWFWHTIDREVLFSHKKGWKQYPWLWKVPKWYRSEKRVLFVAIVPQGHCFGTLFSLSVQTDNITKWINIIKLSG